MASSHASSRGHQRRPFSSRKAMPMVVGGYQGDWPTSGYSSAVAMPLVFRKSLRAMMAMMNTAMPKG